MVQFVRVKNRKKSQTSIIEVYSYYRILFRTEKEQTTDEHNNVGESPKHYVEQKRSQTSNCMTDFISMKI